MSVIITVIGAKPESDEYQGALKLKQILQDGLPNNAIGEIVLHANVTLMGQTVKDIDLMMMGTVQNLSFPLSITNINDDISTEDVDICSFCTTIEIKSHGISGVFREGTEFYVRYGADTHSVTSQSNDQKIATMNFFKRTLGGYSPYISNLIWFTGITSVDVHNLLKLDSEIMPSNVLGNNFSVEELMQLLVWQHKPMFYRGRYHLDSSFKDCSVNELKSVFQLFAKSKSSMGELTRSRIEQITSKAISSTLSNMNDEKMTIYRGRAGTGKTVGLIRTAINYINEKDARVLILTYNRALVSDIRRIFALAELPDMFQSACVSINTMQSFFFRLINLGLYNGTLSSETYLESYIDFLGELFNFLSSDNYAKEMLFEMIGKDSYLNWDYCLIDEAQDWTALERDVLLRLFNPENIVVADGGQQFVRNVDGCDWTVVQKRKNVKLKYCLRQKGNIVKFINHYLVALGKSDQKIISNDKLPGGKVIVCAADNDFYFLCKTELTALKEAGNIPYDMLFFVPHSYVRKSPREFIYTSEFEKHDIFIWDGTKDDVRDTFSLLGDEARVLQYDSGRGLEAWTVICVELDTFIEDKMKQFDDRQAANALLLESQEDRKLKYLVNWLMIPLTRAIDTLVITLKNSESEVSKILIQVALENPDYITLK